VVLTIPKLGYGTHDSQVANGQALMDNHEHHDRFSSCAASFHGRNDRSGSRIH
jgi:hypothetical protein